MASSDYKKFNREIRAFVDVRYDLKPLKQNDVFECYYYNVSGRTNQLQNWQYSESFRDVVNRESLPYEYAILKQDYTKLNNEFFLFNQTSNNCGFISQNTPNELETFDERNVIFEANLQDGLSGITLYFRNNTIKNANIKLYKQGQITPVEREITNNTEERIFIDASDDNYTHIIIETLEWTNPNEKIWILKADLGLTYVYSNSELIEMNIVEEVNKLGEETPINELEIRIGDYEKMYDPLNPKGITKFLREDISTFIPYIGIVNEDGSIEYTKMGTFYFKSIDHNEKEVTLKAGNLIQKLSKIDITDKNKSLSGDNYWRISENHLKSYTENYISTNLEYDYEVSVNNPSRPLSTNTLKLTNTSAFLQTIAMMYGIFYVDRNNKLILRKINKNIVENINKTELLNDIRYIDIADNQGFNIEIGKTYTSFESSTTSTSVFATSFTLKETEETICISSDSLSLLSIIKNNNLSYSGATSVEIIGSTTNPTSNPFDYMLFLKVRGNVGSNVSITGTISSRLNESGENKVSQFYGKGNSNLTISNPLFDMWEDLGTEYQSFLDKLYSYEVNLDYNGNPFIKAGDYIEVESNYGTIPIFVQKHTLKYNGGLSGSIEGVE